LFLVAQKSISIHIDKLQQNYHLVVI